MLFDIKHTKYCYLNSTLWKIEYIYCLRIFCRFEIQMAGATQQSSVILLLPLQYYLKKNMFI